MIGTVVIGGGQAGLAIARCLQRNGVDPVVLDASHQVGDSWRHRYDSLRLFTPAQYDGLPDMPFPAAKDTYPSKDDVAAYLNAYVEHFGIDVRHDCRVDRLERDERSGVFQLFIGDQVVEAASVVVATGALQHAWRPHFATALPEHITQLHTAEYRSPASVDGDAVLIVGAGNSGAQIAEELVHARTCRNVAISLGELPKRLPQRFIGRDIFWWLQRAGVLNRTREPGAPSATAVGSIPLIGSGLLGLVKHGQIRRLPRVVDADSTGLLDADGQRHQPTTVIWATGYRNDFNWISVDRALDGDRQPVHYRGISTTVPRLGFIGLPGLNTKGSAFLGFVGRDAAHLATAMGERR